MHVGRTLLLLSLVALAPSAGAAFAFQGAIPTTTQGGGPQLHCEIVHDAPGAQRCDVFGSLLRADELRVVNAGVGHVFAFADDVNGPFARQLAVVDCRALQCVASFPSTSTPRVALYIYTEATVASTMSITLGRAVRAEPGTIEI